MMFPRSFQVELVLNDAIKENITEDDRQASGLHAQNCFIFFIPLLVGIALIED